MARAFTGSPGQPSREPKLCHTAPLWSPTGVRRASPPCHQHEHAATLVGALHGLAGSAPILALVPFLIRPEVFQPREIGRSAWLLVTLVLCGLLGSAASPHLVGPPAGGTKLRTWQPGTARVSFNPRPHRQLVKFLQQELLPEETFLAA